MLKKVPNSQSSYSLTFPVRNGKQEAFPIPNCKTDKLTKKAQEKTTVLTSLAIPIFFFFFNFYRFGMKRMVSILIYLIPVYKLS